MYPVVPDKNAVPDPATNGLLGTVPGLIGMLQATEMIKLILNIGEPLYGKLMLYRRVVCLFSNCENRKKSEVPSMRFGNRLTSIPQTRTID
jgi:adenylyltransferase/sulfurtransferase